MHNFCKDCPTSIMQLPDDCLYFIFDWLDSASDRETFGLTCHRWLTIQNLSRRRLQFQCSFSKLDFPSLFQNHIRIDTFHLLRLLNRFQQLHFLSLSGCVELPDSGLSQLQHYGSKLLSLHLHCCFGITDCGFSLVASGCSSLTTISLYRCNITDIGLKALSESESLIYLEAHGCKLEPEGIMAIVSGGGLEYLNVSCLSWCILGDGLVAIGAGFATKLRVLDFRFCRTIGDNSIIAIAKGCPLLQEWNLALCHEIRTAGWEAIGINCHNLEKLHVNRCRNICDEGFQALRNGCKKLSVLYVNFRNCRRISSTAIEIFKCLRGNVKIIEEEVACVAPDWAFDVY